MHPMFAAKKQITKYFSCPTISGLLVFLCLYAQNTKAISEKIKRDHVDEYYKRQAKVEPGTSIKLLLNRTRFRAKVSEYVYISLKVCGNLHTTHLLCFRKIPLLFYTKECFENQTGLYTLALLHTSHELHNNNNDFYDMLLKIYVYLQTSDEMKYVHLGLSMSLRPLTRSSCHCPCSFTPYGM